MHYIPTTPSNDDDDETFTSRNSRGSFFSRSNSRSKSRSKRRSNSRQRRKLTPMPPTPPPDKANHKKAAKKIRSLIARTFASHKPKPNDLPTNEEDALLTVIHCKMPSHGDDSSFYTNTSNSQSPWISLGKSINNFGLAHPPPPPGVPPGMGVDDPYYNPNETPEERALRIQKAQKEIQEHMSFPLWQCILAIAIYVVVSVICFSFFLEQKWSLIDSSYFAVVTFTTIGYGDLVPDTFDSRMFTCVWALSGVACLGIALGVLGTKLVMVHEKHMEKQHDQRQSRVIGLFDRDDDSESGTQTSAGHSTLAEGKIRTMFDDMDEIDYSNPRDKHNDDSSFSCWGLLRFILLTAYIAGILYMIAQMEGWDVPKTFYYGVITATTVGYGDFSPQTERGRLLAIFFIPVAVGIMGSFLEKVANSIIHMHRDKYAKQLHDKPLTMETIRMLDSDGDGEVSRAEFIEFMLVAMNEVDKSLLDRLKENFQRLDVDGSGTITKADLAEMAKRKMTDSLRKPDKRQSARFDQYNSHVTIPISNSRAPGPDVPKATLERGATLQTSNRTGISTVSGSSMSYQQQVHMV